MFSEVDMSHGLASLKITWAAIQKTGESYQM